jgi:hypothetical protein
MTYMLGLEVPLQQVMFILTNVHKPQIEGNFSDEHEKAKTLVTAEDYNCHMGYVDEEDKIAVGHSTGYRTQNWTPPPITLDLTILNNYITKCCIWAGSTPASYSRGSSSNLGPETDYPNKRFSWILSVSLGKMLG